MGAREGRGVQAASMQSPVNWALLGLVIERSSYAYELAQRFERTYGETLALSSVSHVYTALSSLESRELIEEVPGSREGRQPRPRYTATEQGRAAYRDWLVDQLSVQRRRRRLFVLELATLAGQPEEALEVIDGYERECLTDASTADAASAESIGGDTSAAFVSRLLAEDARLDSGATLAWIQYARREFKRLKRARR